MRRRDRLIRRHRWLVAALLVIAALVYLAGNAVLPLIDRDEPRFAQASRQMLASGDWVTPRFLDKLRLAKPVLIYWCQATSMRFLGDTAFAARLPSVLATLLTLGVFAAALPRMVGRRRAIWSLFIFATALLPTYLAKVCMADAVQHLWIAVAMLCLYAVWSGTARWPTLVVMGVAIGLAMLTKGPPVFLFLGMTLVALWAISLTVATPPASMSIDVRRTVPRIFAGVAIVLAIAGLVCLPWARRVEAAYPGVLAAMFSNEVVQRGLREKEGHGGPPGFYLVTFWATYFPWCLFAPAAIVQAWRRRHVPWVRFSLAAVVGPWLFLEVYRTKLPHYWLPSYPFLAILTADALLRGAAGRIADLRDRPFLVAAAIWAAITAAVGILVLWLPSYGERPWSAFPFAIALAAGFMVFAWGAFKLLSTKQIIPAAMVMGLGSWALITFALVAYWPRTDALTLARGVADRLVEIGATVPGEVQMIGFKEPSLAFHQGGTIREQSDRAYLIDAPPTDWPRWTVIDDVGWRALPDDRRTLLANRGTFVGSNFADGERRVTVHVLEKIGHGSTMPRASP